jgi:uncharacterized protein (TIGR03435 family)
MTSVTMDYFAYGLGTFMDRPVIDQTGIKGGYNFALAYTMDLPPGVSEGAMVNGAPLDTSGYRPRGEAERELMRSPERLDAMGIIVLV